MTGTPNTQKNIPKRVKGVYTSKETKLIQSFVYDGLKTLKDVGRGVNYENFCIQMGLTPQNIYAPEWKQYCNTLREKFERESDETVRKEIFIECILDLRDRGLLPADTSGLTGNFSTRIAEIL